MIKHPPTAVHEPPPQYLIAEPASAPSLLSRVLRATAHLSSSTILDAFEYTPAPPRFTSEHLARLNESRTRCDASVQCDERNHHIRVHESYLRYHKRVNSQHDFYVLTMLLKRKAAETQEERDKILILPYDEPRLIVNWHGYSPYPGCIRDAQRPQWGIPVEKLLYRIKQAGPVSAWDDHVQERTSGIKRANHFPVMLQVETKAKLSFFAGFLPFAHNQGFRTVKVFRVADSVEDFSGYYSPKTSPMLKIGGGLWGKLCQPCTLFTPITALREPIQGNVNLYDQRPVTWDSHVNYRPSRKLLRVSTNQDLWCKTCVDYREQVHGCTDLTEYLDGLNHHYVFHRDTARHLLPKVNAPILCGIPQLAEREELKERGLVRRSRLDWFQSHVVNLKTRMMHLALWMRYMRLGDVLLAARLNNWANYCDLLILRYPQSTHEPREWFMRVMAVIDRVVYEPLAKLATTELQDWDEGSTPITIPNGAVRVPRKRCKHPLKRDPFTFSTGQTIEMCPRSTTA